MPPPTLCQKLSDSENMIHAPRAAITGCNSNVTDDVEAGRYFIAKTSKPWPPACVTLQASSAGPPLDRRGASAILRSCSGS